MKGKDEKHCYIVWGLPKWDWITPLWQVPDIAEEFVIDGSQFMPGSAQQG